MRTASSRLAVFVAVLGAPWLHAETAARLDLVFVPSRILLGTPFSAVLTLRNTGSFPLQAPRSDDRNHILMALRWEPPGGEGLLPARPGATHSGRPTLEPLAPGQSRQYLLAHWFMPRPCMSGVYSLRATVDMRPWVSGANSWTVSSPETQLDVVDPTGDDLAAYRYVIGLFPLWNIPANEPCAGGQVADLLGDEVLKAFPTSTYAAYVVWVKAGAEGTAQSDPAGIADDLRWGLRVIARSVPCPPGAGCDPNEKLDGQNPPAVAIDRSARWTDIVLKAHPDIWFADELRLRLALDEIIAGKSALGASDLENLGKKGRPDIAEKAGQLLTLVKQKGLVK